jgi:Txe/YoeB family toxin of Txe-Axe toxin-antitoxin module
MRNTGIWLDTNEAIVVEIVNGKESYFTIPSNIEHFHVTGGSGTRLKGGPQDVVQDSKFTERKKHQMKRYFKEIIDHIKDTDALMLFGPADTNEILKKEIETFHKKLNDKIVLVKKVDSMTLNQTRALVRDSFKEMS